MTHSRSNRAARRRAAAINCTDIKKRSLYGRLLGCAISNDGERIIIRHATRGVISRRITDHLVDQLST